MKTVFLILKTSQNIEIFQDIFKDSENNFRKIYSTSMELHEFPTYNNQLFSDFVYIVILYILYILYDVILLNLHFLCNYCDLCYVYFARAKQRMYVYMSFFFYFYACTKYYIQNWRVAEFTIGNIIIIY